MEDGQIIQLFFERSERAIRELERKYGGLCRSIAGKILNDREDAEECVNDALLAVWNAIPPNRPDMLQPYLCRIVRNLSLKKIPFQYRAEKKPAVRCAPGGAFGLPGQRKERGGRDPGKRAGGGAERISESAGQPGPDPVRAEILVLPFHPGNRRKSAHDPECGQSAAAPAPGKTEAISGSEGSIWKGIRKKRNARRMPERAAGKESG